jgi:hypothetical protein
MIIDMNESQIFLQEDDVLSAPATALMYQCTFKVSEFMTVMQSKLLEEKLFSEGMECELLSAGKDWTKGKVRMRLEFCPIEPELEDQKAFIAASDGSETAPNYSEGGSEQTDTDEESNISDSTAISSNFPMSRYPDSDPQSLGMWS